VRQTCLRWALAVALLVGTVWVTPSAHADTNGVGADPSAAARIYRAVDDEYPDIHLPVPPTGRLTVLKIHVRARAKELSP